MDINEVRSRIAKLETDICHSVETLIAAFNAETGENVKAVNIRFASVHEISHKNPRYIVADVNVAVDL